VLWKNFACEKRPPYKFIAYQKNSLSIMRQRTNIWRIAAGLIMSFAMISCQKEEVKQPSADFTTNVKDLEVEFLNTSVDGLTFTWDFGDNTPISTEKSPKHIYATKGKYIVTLTATGASGSTPSTKSTTLNLVIACKDKPGNLLKGGSMEEADAVHWKVVTTTKDETKNNVLVPVNYKFGAKENAPTNCDGGGGSLAVTDKTDAQYRGLHFLSAPRLAAR
jgi:PKD repeat protein